MDATNDDDEAMMAMMGMSGFGTTKARRQDCSRRWLMVTFSVGQTRPGKPRRERKRKEGSDMASIHESVRSKIGACMRKLTSMVF